jgi:glycosyltransferase involved in cell wall biosynthesis
MRLLIVTDAWHPQVNGVVRTLTELRKGLVQKGWQVLVLGPEGLTVACPTYPEIRLTLNPTRQIQQLLNEWTPEAVHIATEGPLGWAMRRVCIERDWPFTTSFHTRFPEYLKSRFAVPRRWTYRVLRHFHAPAERVLVPTEMVRRDLEKSGFNKTRIWGRGVDTNVFSPEKPARLTFPGPILLYVGRLAVEKNVTAFLDLKTKGTKVIVGDGPMRPQLESRYPEAWFLGARFGAELASLYAAADVFVFPSLTDTFGLVLLEALACGTPVAAFPAAGPADVLNDPAVATLNWDLAAAIERSLTLDRPKCRKFALARSWENCVNTFASCVSPFTVPRAFEQPPPPFKGAANSRYYAAHGW